MESRNDIDSKKHWEMIRHDRSNSLLYDFKVRILASVESRNDIDSESHLKNFNLTTLMIGSTPFSRIPRSDSSRHDGGVR